MTREQAFWEWFHGQPGAGDDVGEAFRAGWAARGTEDKCVPLFQSGHIRLHSGCAANWKIECDSLSDEDLDTLAMLIADRVDKFSAVEGVPRGGLRLAEKLRKYQVQDGPLLIVDDVCTTGTSLEQHRAGREAIGYVLFRRGAMPSWTRTLFTLDAQP